MLQKQLHSSTPSPPPVSSIQEIQLYIYIYILFCDIRLKNYLILYAKQKEIRAIK